MGGGNNASSPAAGGSSSQPATPNNHNHGNNSHSNHGNNNHNSNNNNPAANGSTNGSSSRPPRFRMDVFDELESIVFTYLVSHHMAAFKLSPYWTRHFQFLYMTEKKVVETDFALFRVLGNDPSYTYDLSPIIYHLSLITYHPSSINTSPHAPSTYPTRAKYSKRPFCCTLHHSYIHYIP